MVFFIIFLVIIISILTINRNAGIKNLKSTILFLILDNPFYSIYVISFCCSSHLVKPIGETPLSSNFKVFDYNKLGINLRLMFV